MPFPFVSKLDSSLAVEVYLHEFYLGDRPRRCWTYLTKGLSGHGQREMALSLLVDDEGDAEDLPQTPLKMFQLLGERTSAGRIVECGDSTRLGQRGIFGFPGLFYVPAIQYESLPNLDEYLSLILVHREEYDYIRQYGLTRFLSHLGRFCSSFPYPTWNTQARPSLFPNNIREISMLTDASHVQLEHSYAHQLGDVLQLQLHKSDAEKALHAIDNLDDDQVAILNTAFSPRCDASLYWQEGQDLPGAYAAPDSVTGMIGGSFISLCRSDFSDIAIVEDGFSVNLTAPQWHQLSQSIESSVACEFNLDGDRRFVLDFVDVSAKPLARPYQPLAVWRQLTPPEPNTTQSIETGRIQMGAFTNLSGENSLSERVSRDELLDYLSRIHATFNEALSEEEDSFEFELELTVYPDRVESRLVAHIELNPEFTEFIQGMIQKIRSCDVTSQVMIRLPFSVNSTEADNGTR
ncbi:MAG: DUF3480 domain-containing protein [Gammaproteobacteria bacterium]|jgi:hypothetical protein|nr:DUF3480 domain-containing protein [Gammaproteobacteria bacterium]MBT7371108.1 DUF3480 domain-containing protein [Gammaproteobacteria bacterium]